MKTVIAGDFHYPFLAEKPYAEFLCLLQEIKPDKIYLNGDLLDCWEISRLRVIRRDNPEAEIIYIAGNHEFRLNQYIIRNAPHLFSVVPHLDKILELDAPYTSETNYINGFVLLEDGNPRLISLT